MKHTAQGVCQSEFREAVWEAVSDSLPWGLLLSGVLCLGMVLANVHLL